MKHLSEKELILFYYAEAEDGQAIADHLEACHSCREAYQCLRRTLLLVNAPPTPEVGDAEAAAVWNRLRPRLAAPRGLRWTSWLQACRWPRWATAGTAALLLLTAFLAGLYWPRTVPMVSRAPNVEAPQDPAQAHERLLLNQVGNHLERAQVALIELVHSKTNGVVDISWEQALARELVNMNSLCRQTSARLGDTGMANVLEDLERTLIEISNSPSTLSSAEFADLCRHIDSNRVLFKVQVVGAQVRAKERDAARELAVKRS